MKYADRNSIKIPPLFRAVSRPHRIHPRSTRRVFPHRPIVASSHRRTHTPPAIPPAARLFAIAPSVRLGRSVVSRAPSPAMSTRRGVRVWRLERDVTHSFVIARRDLALGRRARAIGGDECVRSSRRRLSRAARATGWTRADDGGDRDRERRRASSSRGRASDAVETAIERAGGRRRMRRRRRRESRNGRTG